MGRAGCSGREPDCQVCGKRRGFSPRAAAPPLGSDQSPYGFIYTTFSRLDFSEPFFALPFPAFLRSDVSAHFLGSLRNFLVRSQIEGTSDLRNAGKKARSLQKGGK